MHGVLFCVWRLYLGFKCEEKAKGREYFVLSRSFAVRNGNCIHCFEVYDDLSRADVNIVVLDEADATSYMVLCEPILLCLKDVFPSKPCITCN